MTTTPRAAYQRPLRMTERPGWNAEPPAATRAEHDRRAREIADWAWRQTRPPVSFDDYLRGLGADL